MVLGVHKNTYMGDYGGVVVSILYSQYVHVIDKMLFISSGRRWPRPLQSVSHASPVEAADAKGGVRRECLESAV